MTYILIYYENIKGKFNIQSLNIGTIDTKIKF
jgi:hypothetical protein